MILMSVVCVMELSRTLAPFSDTRYLGDDSALLSTQPIRRGYHEKTCKPVPGPKSDLFCTVAL